MPREMKFQAADEEQDNEPVKDIPSKQSHGDEGDPNDWIVTAMGIGSTENGQPMFKRGDVIPAHTLTADQIRRLLDAGAMAPRSALPPVVTVAMTTNTDITPL